MHVHLGRQAGAGRDAVDGRHDAHAVRQFALQTIAAHRFSYPRYCQTTQAAHGAPVCPFSRRSRPQGLHALLNAAP